MSMIDKLRKRGFYPVELFDGDVAHIRGLRDSELHEVTDFAEEPESIGYAIGKVLLEDDRSQMFVLNEGESPKEFGRRVLATLDLSGDVKAKLMTAIQKVNSGTYDIDTLKKN